MTYEELVNLTWTERDGTERDVFLMRGGVNMDGRDCVSATSFDSMYLMSHADLLVIDRELYVRYYVDAQGVYCASSVSKEKRVKLDLEAINSLEELRDVVLTVARLAGVPRRAG